MDNILKQIQSTELEILIYFDNFCKENHLKYSLSGGTLLGAIRHKGFIPWDDDVDCMMMREDYDRLISLWNEKADTDKYILQLKDNSPAFSQSFAKIRKNNTTFLQEGEPAGEYHNGLFIDIMPADRFPNGKFRRSLYYIDVMLYQLFTREFVPPKSGFFVKTVTGFILSLTNSKSRVRLRKFYLNKLTKYNNDKTLEIISTETVSSMHRHYSPDLMNETVDVEYEGVMLKASSKWKEILEVGYGDYMKYPPKEEQLWKHHPVVIDFEHNMENIK